LDFYLISSKRAINSTVLYLFSSLRSELVR